jgi:hypothetical protein
MARARRNRKKRKASAEIGPSPLDELLGADVGDGLMIEGQTYAIASVGRSEGGEGFATREYTLGEEEDLYLVVEGQLASGDSRRSRAVKTHELSLNEVLCPGGSGRNSMAAHVLRESDDPPPEVVYQGLSYKFFRRIDAFYSDAKRECDRVSWDYEIGRRNLTIERWPEGEMAVYEGIVVPFDRIRVVPDYEPSTSGSQVSSLPAELGVLAGILLMVFGWLMMFL